MYNLIEMKQEFNQYLNKIKKVRPNNKLNTNFNYLFVQDEIQSIETFHIESEKLHSACQNLNTELVY